MSAYQCAISLHPRTALPDQAVPKAEQDLAQIKYVDPRNPVILNGKSYFWTPYNYSWRYGFEGDPGHQGYHGLKGEVTDEFICLGKPTAGLNETLYKQEKEGSVYFLWTSAYSQNVTNVTIDTGGLSPASVFLDGKKIDKSLKKIQLLKGSNPLLIRYDKPGRGHFVIIKENNILNPARTPLSMKWWDMNGRIAFDSRPEEKAPSDLYRFTAPPGFKSLIMRVNGKVNIWVDGTKQRITTITYGSVPAIKLELKDAIPGKSIIAIRVEQIRGNYDGEVFPEPIEPMMSMATIFDPSSLFLFSFAKLLFLAKRSFPNSISNISSPLDFIIFILLTPLVYKLIIKIKNYNGINFERKD